MGHDATCCATCCIPRSDSSTTSDTPPNRSPVRAVRFVSPVASVFSRMKKDVKTIPSKSNVAVSTDDGGFCRSTDATSATWTIPEMIQTTIPTEFEVSPSPEVYRGKTPWSCAPIESTVSTPASEYDAAPAPEVYFKPRMNWRTSASPSRKNLSPPDDRSTFEFPSPTTPTRQGDYRHHRESMHHKHNYANYQRSVSPRRAGEFGFSTTYTEAASAMRLPPGFGVATNANTHRSSTQSRLKSDGVSSHDRRDRQTQELVDFPMQLAHSLQHRIPREVENLGKTDTIRCEESELPMPKAQWRSSKLRTGTPRPASVSQSQFGRYHVFTILVEKDDTGNLV